MKKKKLLAAAMVAAGLLATSAAYANRAGVNAENITGNYDGFFTEDSAGGGAIWNNINSSMNNATFTNNKAESASNLYGGAVYNGGTMTITGDNSFSSNSSSQIAGALANYLGNINVNSGTLEFNSNSSMVGGALANMYGGLTIADDTNVTFDSNTATHSGGALAHYGYQGFTTNTTIGKKTKFEGNNAEYYGGAIVVSGPGTVNINGSSFKENYTSDTSSQGGAICQYDGSTATININQGTTFEENSSVAQGGAIASDAVLNITNSTFTGNETTGTKVKIGGKMDENDGGGGALFMYDQSKTTITGSTFSENKSGTFGGAISMRGIATGKPGTDTSLSVSDSEFTENSAQYGGAIANSIKNTTISNTTFTDNTATQKGGAIYNNGTITFTGENTFSGNNVNGVVDDIDGSNGTINIAGGTTTVSTIKNQTVNVNAGELHLSTIAADGSNLTGSTVTVNNGAIINTIDDVINDYSSTITLQNGAIIKGDIDYVAGTADKYAAANGATVNYMIANALTVGKGDSKEIQVVSDGATVNKDTAFAFTSENGLELASSGAADGKIKVTGLVGGINTAVDVTTEDAKTNIDYKVTTNETFNGSDNKIEKSEFTITGQGTDTSSNPAITLAADMIVNGDSKLSLKDVIFTGDNILQNQEGASLDIKDSLIGVSIDNYGTLTSDPTTYTAQQRTFSTGSSTYEGDTFTGATASSEYKDGGAIYNEGAITIAKDSDDNKPSFTNNSATNGGAIALNALAATADISDATFKNNTASSIAGAIYVQSGTVNITDSTFEENSAKYGGAIYTRVATDTADLNISGSTFLNNTAEEVGAVGIMREAIITDSTFTGNKATNAASNSDGSGAIFMGSDSHTTITNSTFESNQSAAMGGALKTRGTITNGVIKENNDDATLDVISSTFTGNKAATIGGAIDNTFYNSTTNDGYVTVKNSTFTSNTAASGGAIYNHGEKDNNGSGSAASMLIDGGTFTKNSSTGQGGAIYNAGTIVINNATFGDSSDTALANSAASGGAIYNTGTASISGAVLSSNTATEDGGAMVVRAAVAGTTTTIENTAFENNTANSYDRADSGAISVQRGVVDITGSTFTGNKAKTAGAIYAYNGVSDNYVKVTITDSVFSENEVDGTHATTSGGGAIVNMAVHTYNDGDAGMSILGTTFDSNKNTAGASTGGGALFLGSSSATNIGSSSNKDSSFTNNTSASAGGAIGMRNFGVGNNSAALLDISNTTFSGNTAETTGGAIDNYFYNSTANSGFVTITGSTFTSNSAANGGAIYNHIGKDTEVKVDGQIQVGKINITDTSFTNNTASDKGGAIYNEGVIDVIADQTNVVFSGNSASKGADIYNDNGTVGLSAKEGKTLTIQDGIDGSDGTLNINSVADAIGEVIFNGDVSGNSVNVKAGTLTNNATVTATALSNEAAINSSGNINVTNASNDAVLTNTGTITATENSTITADTLANTNGTINLNNGSLVITYQSDDITGTLATIGGTNNVTLGTGDTSDPAASFTGNLNVQSGTMNLLMAEIEDSATVNISSGAVLNVNGSDSSVVLNSGDTYTGDLVLTDGQVTISEIAVQTGATSTTAGGTNAYYEQTGGNLALIDDASLTVGDASKISGGNVYIEEGSTLSSALNGFTVDTLANGETVNAINNAVENYSVSNLVVGDGNNSSQANFAIDISARSNSNNSSDTIGSDSTIIAAANSSDGVINISDISLLGDAFGYGAPLNKHIDIGKVIKGSVTAGHTIDFTSTDKLIDTAVGSYRLSSTGNGGYSFDLAEYNPQVFRGQVTTLAQYQNQLAISDMLFTHSMVLPSFKENDPGSTSGIMANRYAAESPLYAPYQYSRKDGGLWYKMYGSFEHLNMSRGLRVENNAYGALIGADFGLKELKHGWTFMPTAYIGYNGAHQNFDGIGAYQNGGQAGFLGTWYKNNWIIGALAYGGVYNNEMSTPRGNDDAFGYFAGASTKAAYNWRFHKDWVLQPNLFLSYNYFGKQNWHSDFGQMGMMSGTLNGVNIAPGVNLIWEKETFSTYLTLQYMYNISQSVGGRAGNDIYLPRVSMDRGYIQYGIGFTKTFSDRFSGYLQAVLRNVGRTGVGFQLGFNWKLGKKSSNYNNDLKAVTPANSGAKLMLKSMK